MNERVDRPENMEVESPSGLDMEPRPPRTGRVSRRVRYVIAGLAALLGLCFAYGGWMRNQRAVQTMNEASMPQNVAPATAAGGEITRSVPPGNLPNPEVQRSAENGALQPPAQLPDSSVAAPSLAGPPVVVRQPPPLAAPPMPSVPPAPASAEPTVEERRLIEAYEREQQALLAPTSSRSASSPGGQSWTSPPNPSPTEQAGQIATLLQNLARQPGAASQTADGLLQRLLQGRSSRADDGETDSAAQERKEAFIAKARSEPSADYLKTTRTGPLSLYEIKAGWDIPAVLEQGLNSDLPGEVRALVSSGVFDTATGRHLLIPQGSRLIGTYNSRIGYGQDGLQVVWDRVIFPDGSSLNLSGMVGQDAQGKSGFRDKVDRHYRRLIGFAVLTSLFSAASTIAQNQNRTLLTVPSPGQVAAGTVGQQTAELGAQVTRRNLNVQPTIRIPVGYRFHVRVNRDILFESPYEPASAP